MTSLSQTPSQYLRDLNGPLIGSFFLHIAVFIGLGVGAPYMRPEPIENIVPISIAFAPIDEKTQTPEVKQSPPEPKPAPTPQSKPKFEPKMDAPTPPDLSKPQAPDVQERQEISDVPPPADLELPEKKEEPKPAPKPPAKKPEFKAETKPDQDNQFSSLLKNLTPDAPEESPVQEQPQAQEDTNPAQSLITSLGQQLSVSEIDSIRQQLAPCWNILSGAKYAEDLVVEVRAFLEPDGSVTRATILDQSRYNRDGAFRAAADSARRSLFNPRCTPLNLPANKYNQWKTIVIRFDPRDML